MTLVCHPFLIYFLLISTCVKNHEGADGNVASIIDFLPI